MSRVDVESTKYQEAAPEEFLPYYLGTTQEEAEETYNLFSNLLNIMSFAYAKHTGIDPGDLFAAALEGLARAKRDWDEDRGNCSFKSYATLRIKTAMNDCCRKFKSIVSIPEYIRVAHTYITNIKTILEGYGESPEVISYVLNHNNTSSIGKIHDKDEGRILSELDKLKRLAKNSGVPYSNLIKNAEYVPTDYYLNDEMSQEELQEAERRRLAAALVVSKLQDKMTESELHVANGIMVGKSYGEIGRTHNPKRSIAWVAKTLDSMKEKFSK